MVPQSRQDAAWERRHPEAALGERTLRRERRTIRKEFGGNDFAAGTPETRFRASRTRQGSLARLCLAGALSADQMAWALEIAAVAERIGGEVGVRTMSMETRVDNSPHGKSFWESLGAVRREAAYTAWRNDLPGPAGPILAMIVDDIGPSEAGKRWNMHHRRAKALLITAIDRWPTHFFEARRSIDAADVAAAQAGLI